uniref:Uncharacterized protein n=1 Tax=Solanum lycopersicum TaxID=4081 RepID=A0A3Q7EAZ8_SOLLC
MDLDSPVLTTSFITPNDNSPIIVNDLQKIGTNSEELVDDLTRGELEVLKREFLCKLDGEQMIGEERNNTSEEQHQSKIPRNELHEKTHDNLNSTKNKTTQGDQLPQRAPATEHMEPIEVSSCCNFSFGIRSNLQSDANHETAH